MKKRQEYRRGSKGLLYINQGVSENLIGFINKQSELNGVLLLGLKLVAEKYGDIDVINDVPRIFDVEWGNDTHSPSPQANQDIKQPQQEPINQNYAVEQQASVNQNSAIIQQQQEMLERMRKLELENERLRQSSTLTEKQSQQSTSVSENKHKEDSIFAKDKGEDISIFE